MSSCFSLSVVVIREPQYNMFYHGSLNYVHRKTITLIYNMKFLLHGKTIEWESNMLKRMQAIKMGRNGTLNMKDFRVQFPSTLANRASRQTAPLDCAYNGLEGSDLQHATMHAKAIARTSSNR